MAKMGMNWRMAERLNLSPKKYHMAKLVDQHGHVSALCFKNPRPINLGEALWTNRKEAVTCKKCLLVLAREKETGGIKVI